MMLPIQLITSITLANTVFGIQLPAQIFRNSQLIFLKLVYN